MLKKSNSCEQRGAPIGCKALFSSSMACDIIVIESIILRIRFKICGVRCTLSVLGDKEGVESGFEQRVDKTRE